MSRAASGISGSGVISVPLLRTVADRTVRSVRTSLSAGSDLDTSAGAWVQNGFPTGDRPPTVPVCRCRSKTRHLPTAPRRGQAVMGSGIRPVIT